MRVCVRVRACVRVCVRVIERQRETLMEGAGGREERKRSNVQCRYRNTQARAISTVFKSLAYRQAPSTHSPVYLQQRREKPSSKVLLPVGNSQRGACDDTSFGGAVTEAKRVNINRLLPMRARTAPALSLKLCFMMMLMVEAYSSFSDSVCCVTCCLPRRDGFVAAHVEQLATAIMRNVNEQQTCYPS